MATPHLINQGVHGQVGRYRIADESQVKKGSLGTTAYFPVKSVESKEVGMPPFTMQLSKKQNKKPTSFPPSSPAFIQC